MNTDRPASEQYADITFIPKSKVTPDAGYKIPEAFIWSNTEGDTSPNAQLSGYWGAKYQVAAGTIPIIEADVGARDTSIKVSNVRLNSTDVVTGDARKGCESWAAGSIKYEYYLNGAKKHETTNKDEGYTYTGLTQDRSYAVNIIARRVSDNLYVGAVTKEIMTVGANAPDLTGFNRDTTYYVTWDADGTEKRTSIKQAAPSDWYDYADKKWANIVTSNNGKEAYFVWIPRYSYRLAYSDIAAAHQFAEISFIRGTGMTVPKGGYRIPEAFSWGNNTDWTQNTQLTGYWGAKYQVSQ